MGAKKPDQSSSETVSTEQTEETVISCPIDLSKVDPEKIKMAEDFGIPVRALVAWLQQIDSTNKAIIANLPAIVKQGTMETINEIQQNYEAKMKERATQLQQQPQGGGGSGGMMSDFMRFIMSQGGGGQDSEMNQLSKDLLKASIDRIKREAGYTEQIVNAVVTNIASKAVKNVTSGA